MATSHGVHGGAARHVRPWGVGRPADLHERAGRPSGATAARRSTTVSITALSDTAVATGVDRSASIAFGIQKASGNLRRPTMGPAPKVVVALAAAQNRGLAPLRGAERPA